MDDEKDVLKEALERVKDCINEDEENRSMMLDDLQFCTLDQWDANIRRDRETEGRPCLTIDKINQYIVQVVNDMRQNRPSIKARPVDDNGDIQTAKVLQGLVRHIEDASKAHIAYETSGDWSVKCGRGYFRIITEYTDEMSFDQEIKIKPISDAFSVYLGPHSMPDGSDAEYGFVFEKMTEDNFEREYPKAKTENKDFEGIDSFWKTDEYVMVCEYFYTDFETKELLFLKDGTTVTRDQFSDDESLIADKRMTSIKKIKWCKLTAVEILEKRDWLGKYIPIVEVVGKEANVLGRRVLWGLVRPAKDNLRMYNYWASAITEKIALSPKAPFIVAKGQIDGLEKQWKNANKGSPAVLEYNPIDVNGNAIPRPERVQPPAIEAAMVQTMGMIENDVRASLGMYKASVGDSGSQQSGKALLALQRESDTGTFHFSDNLSNSICHAGRILIDLIPKIYDTERVIRILGEDGTTESVKIDPTQQESAREIQTSEGIKSIYNLGVGKYDVTVTVGPSYNTKRMEAAQVFSELATTAKDPASASVLQYLTIKNSDLTSSDEATSMLKALLPPQALQSEQYQGQVPPQLMQQMQQMQQQIQMMQEEGQQLQQENQQLKSGIAESQMKVQADVQKSQMSLEAQQQTSSAELQLKAQVQAEELQLEKDKIAAQIELDRQVAEAQMALKTQQVKFEQDCKMHDKNMEIQQKQNEMQMSGMDAQTQQNNQQVFLDAIQQIVTEISKPKQVIMQSPSGETYKAITQTVQ
jgi:hypothetical protein